MKVAWLAVLFIFFLNTVVADDININIQKDNYKVGETIIFEIKFNVDLVDPISISQIRVYDFSNSRQSVALTFIKIDEKRYYGYFDVPPLNFENYFLSLNGIEYFKDGKLKRENFNKSFNVVEGISDILSIFPGAYFKKIENWEQPWIDFKLENKGNNTLSFIPQVSDSFLIYDDGLIEILPGREKEIRLKSDVKNINREFIEGKFLIDGYEIPIIFKKTVIEGSIGCVDNTECNISQFCFEGVCFNETILTENNTYIELGIPCNFTANLTNYTSNGTLVVCNNSIWVLESNLIIPNEITNSEEIILGSDSLIFNEDFEEISEELNKAYTVEGNIKFMNNASIDLHNITIELTNDLEEIAQLDKTFIEVLKSNQTDLVGIKINFEHNILRDYNGELVIKAIEGVEDRMSISLKYIGQQLECYIDSDCNIGTCIEGQCINGEVISTEIICIEDSECGLEMDCVNGKCLAISNVDTKENNLVLWVVIGGMVLLGIFVLYFYTKSKKKTYTEVKSKL